MSWPNTYVVTDRNSGIAPPPTCAHVSDFPVDAGRELRMRTARYKERSLTPWRCYLWHSVLSPYQWLTRRKLTWPRREEREAENRRGREWSVLVSSLPSPISHSFAACLRPMIWLRSWWEAYDAAVAAAAVESMICSGHTIQAAQVSQRNRATLQINQECHFG